MAMRGWLMLLLCGIFIVLGVVWYLSKIPVSGEHTVIVTYNAASSIEQFFWQQRHLGASWTVLDAGSTDDTIRIAERWLRVRAPSSHIVLTRDWEEAWRWLHTVPHTHVICCRNVSLREKCVEKFLHRNNGCGRLNIE